MLKKAVLLASMALALAAALAPAAQAEWLHNDTHGPENTPTPLTGATYLHAEGFLEFEIPSAASTFGCEVTVTLVLVEGSTGAVTEFSPTTETCKGTGPAAQFCGLEKHTSTVPWAIHANTDTGDIDVTHVFIENHYKNVGGTCNLTTTPLNFETVTATPDDPSAISTIDIEGKALGGAVIASGTVHVTEDEAGTYGIAEEEG